MVFGFIDDVVHSAINVVDDVISGEPPSKQDIVRLVSTGLTIYAAAELLGITAEAAQEIMDD